jgi:hypothetical protein
MKTIYKQTLVISIILLLVGVSVSSATTNVVKQSLIDDNQPPNPPEINPGPPELYVHELRVVVFNSVDPDGDNISYFVEWGDGNNTGWTDYYLSGHDAELTHIWHEINLDNVIRAKAKDIHGNESDWSILEIPVARTKVCDCKEVSKSDLIHVERLLDKVEVYSKLLLVMSRQNPEIRELNEDLSNMISPLNTLDLNDLICNILWEIGSVLGHQVEYIEELLERYNDNPIIYKLIYSYYMILNIEAFVYYYLIFMFGCYWNPYP